MTSQEQTNEPTLPEPEVGKVYTITTQAGGKDYSHNIREYILLNYVSYQSYSYTKHNGKIFLSKSHLTIDTHLKDKVTQSTRFSVTIFNEGYFVIDENVLKRLTHLESDEATQACDTLALSSALRLLGERGLSDSLLIFILDAQIGSIICTGSENVLRRMDAFLGGAESAAANISLGEKETTDSNTFPNPTEPTDANTILGQTETSRRMTGDYAETGRHLLTKETVEIVIARTNGEISVSPNVLKGCVDRALLQFQEWMVSVLSDVILVTSSEEDVRNISDHVMDCLTQCFKQAMLDLQENRDYVCRRRVPSSTDHVSVLQKLSPRLIREIRLEGTLLLDHMCVEEALSETERQSILAHPTMKRKNEAFIDTLCANYSTQRFKEVFLPILNKDEDNQHLAETIEEEMKRQDKRPRESKCTLCKVKGLIDLRALSEHLLSLNSINQALRRDLCSRSIQSSVKWKELLKVVDKETFLAALQKKYPHFHEEFVETGDSPLGCCCEETQAREKFRFRRLTDVANLHDLVSEIGTRSVDDERSSLRVDWEANGTPNSTSSDFRKICGICQQKVSYSRSLQCGHVFCRVCICSVHRLSKMCPVCGSSSTAIFGTMPPGTMIHTLDRKELPGFRGYDTIAITYCIKDGVQTTEHPNPGKTYRGISCTAYLPNTREGQIVLRLLQTAWERRLTFTLKQSVSSTQQCVLTWNRIAHKTNRTGGPDCQGYPDPGYLRRVKKDLDEHGILEEDLRSTMV